MEFINRSKAPAYLVENKARWTSPWVDFYQKTRDDDGELKRKSKPTDCHWTDDRIRNRLIRDFKNNCGYCGCSRPTPKLKNGIKKVPKGHVDHYRAKAVHPHLTYEWTNYIWSCEACNTHKGEFDSDEYPIFNPCNLDDCGQIEYIADTGEYCLLEQSDCLFERFKNTEQHTLVNSEEVSKRRCNRVKLIKKEFDSIILLMGLVDDVRCQLLVDLSINTIKQELQDPEFYFLVSKTYQQLCRQHPEVAQIIKSSSTK